LALVILGFLTVGILVPKYNYQGSIIDPPAPAPDFELTAADGKPFRLADHRGRIVLLYFGYTFCPDVCPTTLYDLTLVKEKLGEQSRDLVVAMISVDPERDPLPKLGEYVTTFDPVFYGLSGATETLASVWADYGVYVGVNEVEGASGYLIDHTARVYVVDRGGNLRLTFPFGMDWEAMAADLEYLLKE
jgi:protein SCO1